MERLDKFIRKINLKDAEKIYSVIEKIIKDDFKNLNIKKLRGFSDVYRVRVGKYRIIYTKKLEETRILEISISALVLNTKNTHNY
jgi:mRNA-degrading endonuclease RelE of RelBE toxin-antitoxin system